MSPTSERAGAGVARVQRIRPMMAGLSGFVATTLAILIHAAANGAAPFA